MGLWSTKSLASLQADTRHHNEAIPRATLGQASLIALGVGAIIGTGIFVRTGTGAAQYAGPAIIMSFILSGLGCLMVAMCYAEIAGMVPVSGGTYAYAHVAFGELAAWMIGWTLTLEYFF